MLLDMVRCCADRAYIQCVGQMGSVDVLRGPLGAAHRLSNLVILFSPMLIRYDKGTQLLFTYRHRLHWFLD